MNNSMNGEEIKMTNIRIKKRNIIQMMNYL